MHISLWWGNEEKTPLARLRPRIENNIKMGLK